MSTTLEIDFFLPDSYKFFSSSCAVSVLIFVLVDGPLWPTTGVFVAVGGFFLPTSTAGVMGFFTAVVGFAPIVGFTGGCSKLQIFKHFFCDTYVCYEFAAPWELLASSTFFSLFGSSFF